jgi:hypothetical protein
MRAHGSGPVPPGTQAQTVGSVSNVSPFAHGWVALHWQTPGQLRPALGVQRSLGSSTQTPAPAHAIPAVPPHTG